MSKVIVTNTTVKPVFVAGRLLGVGMSMEVEAHQVPDCLQPLTPATETPEPAPVTGQTETPPSTDEERLVEAAAKAKK